MNKILFVFACVVLSGCFFDNKVEPEPKKPMKDEIVGGSIIMEDVHGVEHGSKTDADFMMYGLEEEKSVTGIHGAIARKATAQSSPCVLIRNPKKEGTNSFKATPKEVISVGKMAFAQYGSENLIELEETDKHHYQHPLKEGIGSGIYTYYAQGKNKAPKFYADLSMPEDLTKVLVNGFDFSKDPVNIKKSENIKASWNSTTLENDNDKIMLSVLTETESEKIELNCNIQERQLTSVDNVTSWEINKEEFKDLPLTTNKLALIALYRYHFFEINNKEPLLRLIGLRVYNTVAGIGE